MVGISDFSIGLIAQNYVDAEDFKNLDILIKNILPQRMKISALHAIQAYTHHRLGRVEAASAAMARAMGLDAHEPFVNYFAGRLAIERGQRDAAVRHFGAAIDVVPWFAPAHDRLIPILFPGLEYHDVFKIVHGVFKPGVYFEIGVSTGASLALADKADIAVGVDPDLSGCTAELGSNTRLFATTSDAFFAGLDRTEVLRDRPVDLGFIDGMHHFEYSLRDFINIERLSRPGGMILIHDVVPVSARVAARERTSGPWTGDVWKILPCLAELRPDLDISLIMTAPSGLAVVRNLDPASTVLANGLDGIVDRFGSLPFSGPTYWQGLGLRPIAAELAAIEQLLTEGAR
ncbi:MAG: class I SAM-dependent methyltransferase [Alphaproteobacteria bacterium]|nr:class I SAM-dependent methyltransferase [Alphaproteobacteria bacterium]